MYLFHFFSFSIYLIGLSKSQKNFSSFPCYQTNQFPRIIGGVDANINEFPFIVSLIRRGGHFCGATILNHHWIITAGHCLCNGFNRILKPSHIKGVIGLHKLSDYKKKHEIEDNLVQSNDVSSTPIEIQFKSIIVHPNYKCNAVANDIALLKVLNRIQFTSHYIQPACITTADSNGETYENTFGIVSGWGWTNENHEIGSSSDILQKAIVKIWSNEKCQKSYLQKSESFTVTDSQICAGYESGNIDSCWTDSGGPLVTGNTLIGIVSTGIGCGRPGLPGIYTRIGKYTKWIESVII